MSSARASHPPSEVGIGSRPHLGRIGVSNKRTAPGPICTPGSMVPPSGCGNHGSMSTRATDRATRPPHGSVIADRWSTLRVRLAASQLDLELANGADPSGSPELADYAERLASESQRRKLAETFSGLVETARTQGTVFSARVPLRSQLVLEHQDELRLLAAGLQRTEPIDSATLARLTLLVSDGRGPLYVGGRAPEELLPVIRRALRALDLA